MQLVAPFFSNLTQSCTYSILTVKQRSSSAVCSGYMAHWSFSWSMGTQDRWSISSKTANTWFFPPTLTAHQWKQRCPNQSVKSVTHITQILQHWTNTKKFAVLERNWKRFIWQRRQAICWRNWDKKNRRQSSIYLKCSKTVHLRRLRTREMSILITIQ